VSGWSPRSRCPRLLLERVPGGLWVSPKVEISCWCSLAGQKALGLSTAVIPREWGQQGQGKAILRSSLPASPTPRARRVAAGPRFSARSPSLLPSAQARGGRKSGPSPARVNRWMRRRMRRRMKGGAVLFGGRTGALREKPPLCWTGGGGEGETRCWWEPRCGGG